MDTHNYPYQFSNSPKLPETQRILLIDDSEIDLLIHEKIIRKNSPALFIDMERSAQTAIDFLKTRSFSNESLLILLDINMPSMNGFDFLEAFIKLPHHIRKVCKIVMVSSSSLEEDRTKASEYECVINYLEKPLNPNQIHNLISSNC